MEKLEIESVECILLICDLPLSRSFGIQLEFNFTATTKQSSKEGALSIFARVNEQFVGC